MNTKKIVISMLVFALVATAITPLYGQAKQSNLQPSSTDVKTDLNKDRNISWQLVIHSPEWVRENTTFLVTITDENGTLVPHSRVRFFSHTYQAPNGTVTLLAPEVNATLDVIIYAYADFPYNYARSVITIVDRRDYLVIHAPSSVSEGELFNVVITRGNGEPLDSHYPASVTFFNQFEFTNYQGMVELRAPIVSNNTNLPINAFGILYYPAETKMITIIDRNITIGDMNGNGRIEFADINPFVYALSHNESQFQVQYPQGHYWAADINQDFVVNFGDIDGFVALLSGN